MDAQTKLDTIQELIDNMEIGYIFDGDSDNLTLTEPLTELGLFVNRIEQIIKTEAPKEA